MTSGFGATGYTVGIPQIMKEFDISMTVSVLGLSLYFWGLFFAPIITPHLSEAFGRATVYLVSLPIFALFILGGGFSKTFASLAICRFFAGFFGGPALVLIEGTFADVWSGDATLTYYSVLTLASYVGVAAGTSTFTLEHALSELTNASNRSSCLWLCYHGRRLEMDPVDDSHDRSRRLLHWHRDA